VTWIEKTEENLNFPCSCECSWLIRTAFPRQTLDQIWVVVTIPTLSPSIRFMVHAIILLDLELTFFDHLHAERLKHAKFLSHSENYKSIRQVFCVGSSLINIVHKQIYNNSHHHLEFVENEIVLILACQKQVAAVEMDF